MQQRVRISDNSSEDLVGIGLFSIFTPALIVLMIQPHASVYVLPICLTFWIGGIIAILSKRFVDQIEFDEQTFYVSSWKGKAKATVPLNTITSLIISDWGYRFHYVAPNGKKRYFLLLSNEYFDLDQMKAALRTANPYVFINPYHVNGFGFLIIRNEEWYK